MRAQRYTTRVGVGAGVGIGVAWNVTVMTYL